MNTTTQPATHTRLNAPWHVHQRKDGTTCIRDCDDALVAEVYTESDAPTLAAAPDLLAALNACYANLTAALSAMKETEQSAPKSYAALDKARAAIARAKGQGGAMFAL